MRIRILELIEGAGRAEGLTVIIDVFRAFTTECYAFDGGAAVSYPVGRMEDAFAMKRAHPDWILLGERKGAKVEGCDLGNSPYDVTRTDFRGRTMIHSTSAGTQGIVAAASAGAEEILTGSLVNAEAVARYIRFRNPETVSIVAMGNAGISSAPEDLLCARYIRSLLDGTDFPLEAELSHLRTRGGEKFFDPGRPEFPPEDYPLCVDCGRFPFVLKVGTDEDGRLVIRRKDPPFERSGAEPDRPDAAGRSGLTAGRTV